MGKVADRTILIVEDESIVDLDLKRRLEALAGDARDDVIALLERRL